MMGSLRVAVAMLGILFGTSACSQVLGFNNKYSAAGGAGSSGGGGGPGTKLKVTASASGTVVDDIVLKVYVVTGGTEAGGAVVVDGDYGSPSFSISPNGTGSVIVEGIYDADNNNALTPIAKNSTDDKGTTTDAGRSWWFGHYTGTVNGSTCTLGAADDGGWTAWGAYEVMPAGASTPAIDSSTPAAADIPDSHSRSATTAFFVAPAGAVLVALAVTQAPDDPGFSVSDTTGLVWTQRGTTYAAYNPVSAVFTATVPSH